MSIKVLNRSFWAILISLSAVACTSNDVYFQYQSVAVKGWNKDSVYKFDIPITDTLSSYNVYVNVRNRGEYPFQNLWVFLSKTTPDSIESKDALSLAP